MREITMYKADNGKLFETAEKCKKYETEVRQKVDEIWGSYASFYRILQNQ